jgi:hypothetical protein
MPFFQLTLYCRSNTKADIARILKVSARPARIKYKFGIQVRKGIKDAIQPETKIGNKLSVEIINT